MSIGMIAYSKPASDKYKENFNKIFNKSKDKKNGRHKRKLQKVSN